MFATKTQPIITEETNQWAAYFRHNRDNLLPIDWHDDYQLSQTEHDAILHSMQQFQLGESSDGKQFIEQAQRYSIRSGDVDYLDALRLFIQEEQRHAADLGRFMQIQNLPLAESHWVDTIFRRLRHLTNLEISIVVLLTAEIIAVPYYTALHDATQAPILRQICNQILHDEIQHLHFQVSTLQKIRRGRSRIQCWLASRLQEILFGGTLFVVWSQHRSVFQAGGFSFKKFWQACWQHYRQTHQVQS